MRKLFLFFLLSQLLTLRAQDASMVFRSESLIYCGLDFTQARLIGDFGNGGGFAMRDKMFPEWNELILKESGKFNLAKTFRKSTVDYDLGPVMAQNAKTNEGRIRVQEESPISPEKIAEMIRAYPPGEKNSGPAVTFIVESFNKNTETAVVHICFFDVSTKKLLFTEALHGEPKGVGLRNYWANAINDILIRIRETYYRKWEKKYAGS